jgi:hypothetical protein
MADSSRGPGSTVLEALGLLEDLRLADDALGAKNLLYLELHRHPVSRRRRP